MDWPTNFPDVNLTEPTKDALVKQLIWIIYSETIKTLLFKILYRAVLTGRRFKQKKKHGCESTDRSVEEMFHRARNRKAFKDVVDKKVR